jgi:hypothetical protein
LKASNSHSLKGTSMPLAKIPLTEAAKHLPEKIDVFIGCISFETRCYSVAAAIGRSVAKALLFENSLLRDVAADHGKKMVECFQEFVHVDFNSHDPVNAERAVADVIRRHIAGSGQTIVVDISTFTREVMLILIHQLKLSYRGTNRIFFTYVGAAKYATDSADEAVWLSKGVLQTRSVLGFPGEVDSDKRVHLIVLAGFESDRASEIIEVYEPSVLSVGFGPAAVSVRPEHYQLNILFHRKIAALYQNVNTFEFPPSDPWVTALAIEGEIKKHPTTRPVIAPLNTKLSTLGAILAAYRNPSIQICYAEAAIYNFKNYCDPEDTCYLFDLPEIFAAQDHSGSADPSKINP